MTADATPDHMAGADATGTNTAKRIGTTVGKVTTTRRILILRLGSSLYVIPLWKVRPRDD